MVATDICSSTRTFTANADSTSLTFAERGHGYPFLLLHGGSGSQTVSRFAGSLATEAHARVITPIHPGFDGTVRPGHLVSIGQLAKLYADLLADLGLADVTVVGNSLGAWIAVELALLGSPRVSSLVLVDAVDTKVASHQVADSAKVRLDSATRRPAARAAMAGNCDALAVYGGRSMTDPSLAPRLACIDVPTLVLGGGRDRIVDSYYGRAYAAAIPGAQFRVLPGAGHLPQVQTPCQLLEAICCFANTNATSHPAMTRSRSYRPDTKRLSSQRDCPSNDSAWQRLSPGPAPRAPAGMTGP